MDAIGSALASALQAGDCVLLDGPMGAGKSHLARAIIRARLADPQAEVPSPTYTLLNVFYDGEGEIYHGDLYRISSAEEITELGIEDAVPLAIILLEWPDRWPSPPKRHLRIEISVQNDNARLLRFLPQGDWNRVRQKLEAFS